MIESILAVAALVVFMIIMHYLKNGYNSRISIKKLGYIVLAFYAVVAIFLSFK